MELGKLSVWCGTDGMSASNAVRFAKKVEDWGYSALWIPDALGREPFTHASWLLANTKTLILATGITSIYGRDPRACKSGQNTLNEQSGGRFLLGLGVSHKPLVEGIRGHDYGPPVATMRAYLEAMTKVDYSSPLPAEEPPTVIAALGPKMLALSASHSQGAHPYLVPPEHTAEAREIVGPDTWICTEQKVLLETDASKARALARKSLTIYMGLPNYRNNIMRFGFSEDDFENGGSDRLVDALVAWGDEKAIQARLQDHLDAGATQVCIQALNPAGTGEMMRGDTPDERILEALAPS